MKISLQWWDSDEGQFKEPADRRKTEGFYILSAGFKGYGWAPVAPSSLS